MLALVVTLGIFAFSGLIGYALVVVTEGLTLNWYITALTFSFCF